MHWSKTLKSLGKKRGIIEYLKPTRPEVNTISWPEEQTTGQSDPVPQCFILEDKTKIKRFGNYKTIKKFFILH